MDRAAAAAIAIAFSLWLGWNGYVRSEEWIKTAKRWRRGMTGDGYARWAARHDGQAIEVLLSAVATLARQATRATRAIAGRRAGPASPSAADDTEPTDDTQPAQDTQPTADTEPARDPQPAATEQDPAPGPAAGAGPAPDASDREPAPTPEKSPRPAAIPVPDPAPALGDPMSLTNRPGGEIVGLSALLSAWRRLISSGDADRTQAAQVSASTRRLADSSDALCNQINATLTTLGQLEAACYRHSLESAALTRVHEAMETAGAALNAQRRAHNDLCAAANSMRAATSAHAAAVAAYQAALDYLNRTHRPKAEVEATTGARSDRDFSTS